MNVSCTGVGIRLFSSQKSMVEEISKVHTNNMNNPFILSDEGVIHKGKGLLTACGFRKTAAMMGLDMNMFFSCIYRIESEVISW